MTSKNRTWAEIDLDALKFNFTSIKAVLKPETKVMCVIKSDAYGHGCAEFARVLEGCGADAFAVATIEEALLLRRMGHALPLLILGHVEASLSEELVKNDIASSVYDSGTAKALSVAAKKLNLPAKIHIALDTGMTRIGFCAEEKSVDEIISICRLPGITAEGIFTHFAKSDEKDKSFSREQFKKFTKTVNAIEARGLHIPIKHAANSAAICDLPEYQLDMVRPGIILYGYYPSGEVNRAALPLKPVMSIKSRITRIADAAAGTPVSYGGIYRAGAGGERIATVPVGYADGYLRGYTGRVFMICSEKAVPVVGRICMDQCMINASSVNNINVGDEITVMGREGDTKIDAEDLAKIAGTISYEILCMTGRRLTRVYLENGKAIRVHNYLNNW